VLDFIFAAFHFFTATKKAGAGHESAPAFFLLVTSGKTLA
jgi:hypothetical protein